MTIGIRGDDNFVCGSFGCRPEKSFYPPYELIHDHQMKKTFIQVADELNRKKCNHNPMANRTTLKPIIKRPLAALTPEEKEIEMAKPNYFCQNCGDRL